MKKILYTTTALAAVGLLALAPSDAMAQKKKMASGPKLTLGGYYRHTFGWSNQDNAFEDAVSLGYNSFNNTADSEVYFKTKTKLDNGITISTLVQMESDRSNTAAANIDESWIQFDGAFGTLRAGTTAAAGVFQSTQAPTTGQLSHFNADLRDYVVRPAAVSTWILPGLTGSAAASGFRYNYFTPRFSGFRASLGYLPSNSVSDGLQASGKSGGTSESQIDYHLNYKGKLGDVSVKADVGGYNRLGSGGIPDENQWRTGINLGFGGFTIGGAYQDVQMDLPTGGRSATSVNSTDAKTWGIGISYKTGPWTIATNYHNSQGEGRTDDPDEDETTVYGVDAKYNLSKGIDLGFNVIHMDFDDESSNTAGNAANSNDGWLVITGVKVSF